MIWTCPCGASNGDNRDRCRSCGRILFHSQGTAAPKKERVGWWAFLYVCGAAILAGGIFWQSNKSMDNPATPSVSKAAKLATVPKQQDHLSEVSEPLGSPVEASAPLDDPDAKELLRQRKDLIQVLKFDEAMLGTASFAARARIFCRFRMPSPGGKSIEELESDYAQLVKNEPPTREEEFARQQKMMMLRDVIAAAYENMRVCQSTAQLPTEDQSREEATTAQQQISEIDHRLASSK